MVASRPAPHSELWLLVRGDQSTPISAGEHVLGRALECEVRIEASGVSRRHARLVVYPGTAIITDLQSRNGTYVNRRRIAGPTALASGDEIGIGTVTMIIRFPERAILHERGVT
jgi:pSer/pThr/pTyr-binding forkhead associated (FHA) protein